MRNHEILKVIYDRCPDMRDGIHLTTDQYVDRCQDIIDLIERERPKIAKTRKKVKRMYGLENHNYDS
jgi:hypothetical protein